MWTFLSLFQSSFFSVRFLFETLKVNRQVLKALQECPHRVTEFPLHMPIKRELNKIKHLAFNNVGK
jgi:hypothetical protein